MANKVLVKVVVWIMIALFMCVALAVGSLLLMMAWNHGVVPSVEGTHPVTYSGSLWLTAFNLFLIAAFRGNRSADEK